jgi:hypothetical protein
LPLCAQEQGAQGLDREVAQQLDHFMQHGTWLVFCDEELSGEPGQRSGTLSSLGNTLSTSSAKGPSCFASLQEFEEHVQKTYLVRGCVC